MKINLDALGITASLACAIHCAVLPLFFSSLPLLGYNILESRFLEWSMIALALIIGSVALWHGFRQHHGKVWPLVLFAFGILLLSFKEALAHSHSWYWVAPAVLLIVGGHLLNYFFCRRANSCHVGGGCTH